MKTLSDCKTPQQCKDFLRAQSEQKRSSLVEDAAIENNLDAIQNILRYSTTNCDRALFYAASQGHTQAVQLVLPYANPKFNDSEAFCAACQFGMVDAVKILLPLSDPQRNSNHPLRAAASNGHAEVVRCILPFTDPKDVQSAALVAAAFHQHWDVVNLLFDLSDVPEVKSQLRKCGEGPWLNFENEVEARRQQTRITNELNANSAIRSFKKI